MIDGHRGRRADCFIAMAIALTTAFDELGASREGLAERGGGGDAVKVARRADGVGAEELACATGTPHAEAEIAYDSIRAPDSLSRRSFVQTFVETR